jgi:hypothetical protein
VFITNSIKCNKSQQADVDALITSADSYADQAEQLGSVTLITKSNVMRRGAKPKSTAKERELKNAVLLACPVLVL